MYDIKDRFYLSIKIDGKFLPLNAVTLKSITMHSNVVFGFPTADIVLADAVRYFDNTPILDNSTIEIISGSDYSLPNKPVYRFRVTSINKSEQSHVDIYNIHCNFNAPRYVNENFKGAINDSSSNIIRAIAQQSGLPYITDATSDNQVWYGLAKKRFDFANSIAAHSYLNEGSCFGLGLTLDGTLKLKNISGINFNSGSLFIQGNKVNNTVKSVLGYEESTESGFFNYLMGYKFEALEQGTDSFETYATINLPVKSTTVNINRVLNENLSGSSLKIGPVSSGNVHTNYYKAEYQNLRIKATYANSLYITLNEETRLDLFDPIKYALVTNVNGKVQLNNKLSGGYIITGKAIHIEPGYYYEKLKITRQGYNLNVINSRDKKILGLE